MLELPCASCMRDAAADGYHHHQRFTGEALLSVFHGEAVSSSLALILVGSVLLALVRRPEESVAPGPLPAPKPEKRWSCMSVMTDGY